MCMYDCVRDMLWVIMCVLVWRSEDNVLAFSYHVVLGRTKSVRRGASPFPH